jgi:tetratricopeptide (TPR) repeat protein
MVGWKRSPPLLISAAPGLARSVGRILRRQILVDQMCEPVRRTTRIQEAADAYCASVRGTWGVTRGGSDLNLALSQALRAVTLDPDIADAHITVGLSYTWLGGGDRMDWREAAREAREAYDRSLVLDPENPRAFGLLGRIENLEMNYPAAEAAFRESIAREPLLPRAGPTHGRLAMLAYAQARIDKALEHSRRSLLIDDSNAVTYNGLSQLLRSTGDYRGAINAANAGLDLDRTGLAHVLLLVSLVEAYNELGESSKAIEILDKAIASAGAQWEPMLAGTLAYLGRTAEAREILAALERLEQPPTVVMAEGYAQLADDRAFGWVHTAIKAHNGSVVGKRSANDVLIRMVV